MPRAEDLEAIRAMGFAAVTWPDPAAAQPAVITRLAAATGLKVVFRGPADVPEFIDIHPNQMSPDAVWAVVWRAVAHGGRVLSFDPGATDPAALTDPARQPAWVSVAAAVGRQFGANGSLFGRCRVGPAVALEGPAAPGLDIVLLDAGRSWVVVATNAARARAHVTARLPAGVPNAMWLNLLDGSTMAMLEEVKGPRWVFDLEGGGVRMYVIDKALK